MTLAFEGGLISCEPDDPRFAQALTAADLPACGADARCFASADGSAFGAIQGEGADRLLRSVVVQAGRRGEGIGATLGALLVEEARKLGAERLWLLTTAASGFFARLGWAIVPRDAAPPAIRASDQFTSLCPSSATLMLRELAR